MTTANATIVMNTPGGGEYRIGNDQPMTFLAGPCAMESRDHAMMTAERLKGIGERVGVNIIYKTSYDKANRTSIHSPRGLGLEKAMPIFDEIRREIGLPCVTDVHTEEHCRLAGQHVDVLQIPAFLCRQTDLLVAAAETGKVINVKKGQFLAPWDMKNVLNKVVEAGNGNVMACERGASFGYNTLVTDFRGLPIMKSFGSPVVFDATHSVQQPGGQGGTSGGQREFVPHLARAAASIGIAAMFMETHPDPDNAPSDGPNMIPMDQFEDLLEMIMKFDRLSKSLN
ncbi:3-deoxy-8-phosphooctulonate synthase [Robiginitomaculum antarcticum]|uniref:3-deoxy-8-phosphooctulonate synthase n=1 Tax=Robiginitomaculum antarcticum TaxID=437507 RepID=UPI0003780ED6|nr:3-deoxy-8-phosphooctulonate synthase [Robiginitomaculum antarcticum]